MASKLQNVEYLNYIVKEGGVYVSIHTSSLPNSDLPTWLKFDALGTSFTIVKVGSFTLILEEKEMVSGGGWSNELALLNFMCSLEFHYRKECESGEGYVKVMEHMLKVKVLLEKVLNEQSQV